MKPQKPGTIVLLGSYAPSLIRFRGPLIQALLGAGWNVVAAAPDLTDDVRELLQAWGATSVEVPLGRTGLSPRQDLGFYRAVKRLLAEVDASYLLTYTIKPNVWGCLAASSGGVQASMMVTGLGYGLTSEAKTWKSALVRRISKTLYRRATRGAHRVVFQNTDDQADLIEMGCLADISKACVVNGSGVDIEAFEVVPLPPRPVFLLIGRLLKSKGIREYVAAARIVKQQVKEARFILVGGIDEGQDGIDEEDMAEWEHAGVTYVGSQNDVRTYLSEASVFVLPSYREGTPRSVLEAMAMGRPIITTDAPGCRATTVDGENGFLVPPRNVEALASKMELLAESPDLRERMGKASREIAERKYDVRIVNSELIKHLGL